MYSRSVFLFSLERKNFPSPKFLEKGGRGISQGGQIVGRSNYVYIIYARPNYVYFIYGRSTYGPRERKLTRSAFTVLSPTALAIEPQIINSRRILFPPPTFPLFFDARVN